jgi:two-component system KDP operon response regulator KdpE
MHEKKTTILIVDDESQIRKMLNIYLDSAEFKVEEAETGKQAIRLSTSIKPDLILLDLGLPDIDGKEVINSVRQWAQTPIVVLSVRADDEEIVAALDLGADDYVIKPFSAEVLLSRIKANLRKGAIKEAGEPQLVNGDLRMDLVRHEVFLKDEKVALTPKEYDLLRYFIINRGKMLTHRQLLREVWGPAHSDDMQYLRVYIGQIREKLEENAASPKLIITEPGIGYRMEIVTASAKAA